jgi:hypothetical protein
MIACFIGDAKTEQDDHKIQSAGEDAVGHFQQYCPINLNQLFKKFT